ncbi:MAG TPA: ROK family protein [Rectinemataceae bacterium]|nr:ROK family protein [Rectinemataceae bacterium]
MERVLAIDLGGTKIAAGIVDADGRLLCRRRAATPLGDPKASVDAMVALGTEALQEAGPAESLGVALPGVVDRRTGMLRYSPSSGWRDVPFASMLADAFSLPVAADNDVNACAWAEALFGAGIGLDCFFWLTVSTGIGGAIVSEGRVREGASGMAGEVGHLVVNPGGRLCGCGNRGCLEAEAAGPAWRRCALQLLEERPAGKLAALPRELVDARAIAELARAGDALCLEVVERMGAMLARGLAAVASVLDPEAIVIGGGVAASLDILLPVIAKTAPDFMLSGRERGLRVQPSSLGCDAALVGAAALALKPYR